MKKLINNKSFVIPFTIWFIVGAFVLLNIEKGDLVLWFNNHRMVIVSMYFTVASKLAEWEFILLFTAILLYKKYGHAFLYLLTWAFTGIIAQSLKRLFDLPRPAGYFTDITLNFLNKDSIHYAHSFPSGHTTTAFAMFFILALLTQKDYLKFLFFVLALSTAFARVYLLQHFFIDVYFGSILGILIAYIIFETMNSSNIFGFQNWKNRNFRKRF